MKKTTERLLAGLAGTLLAIISYNFITGWYNTILWVIAALITGYLSKTRRDCIINGAVFGYFLFLVYISMGYSGKTDVSMMMHFILFDIGFSLLGAAAGGIGSFIGNWVRQKVRRRDS
jgi:hypothetical protein